MDPLHGLVPYTMRNPDGPYVSSPLSSSQLSSDHPPSSQQTSSEPPSTEPPSGQITSSQQSNATVIAHPSPRRLPDPHQRSDAPEPKYVFIYDMMTNSRICSYCLNLDFLPTFHNAALHGYLTTTDYANTYNTNAGTTVREDPDREVNGVVFEMADDEGIAESISLWYSNRGFTAFTRMVLLKDQEEMVAAVVYKYGR